MIPLHEMGIETYSPQVEKLMRRLVDEFAKDKEIELADTLKEVGDALTATLNEKCKEMDLSAGVSMLAVLCLTELLLGQTFGPYLMLESLLDDPKSN